MKDTFFCPNLQLNLGGNLKNFKHPLVMGILNITPDSFYSKSRTQNESAIIEKAGQMIEEGADILDIGGYSSRPGANHIAESEELNRVVKGVKAVRAQYHDILISVDTFRAEIAEAALNEGADIINDISGGQYDEKIYTVAAQYNVPYILMHMRGTPQNMQQKVNYQNLITDIQFYFSERIKKARENGVHDIIIDPGFGFSKTIEQNFELLSKLEMMHLHDCPILVGISRKSTIYKTLDISVAESLNGTTVLNTIALQKGASILRVHDVKEAVETVKLVEKVNYH